MVMHGADSSEISGSEPGSFQSSTSDSRTSILLVTLQTQAPESAVKAQTEQYVVLVAMDDGEEDTETENIRRDLLRLIRQYCSQPLLPITSFD